MVSRWFGGIELGAGGWCACGGAAAQCLRLAQRQPLVAMAGTGTACAFGLFVACGPARACGGRRRTLRDRRHLSLRCHQRGCRIARRACATPPATGCGSLRVRGDGLMALPRLGGRHRFHLPPFRAGRGGACAKLGSLRL